MKKEKFDVTGMTCSSCSAHVDKAVRKLEGVKDVNVNLLSNSMVVEYEENKTNNDEIIKSVIDAGYSANISVGDSKKVKTKISDNKDDEIKSMKNRLKISFAFLIPLMFLAMHKMIFEMFGLPIPNIIKNIFDGTENAIIFAFTQLLLVIPIIYVNRKYYIVGFKRLFKGSPNMDSLIALGSSASVVYGIFAIFMMGYGFGHNKLEIVERYLGDIYFESAGTILTLITLGKYFETKSKRKTGEAITKLMDLAPKVATVIRDGKEIDIPTEDIIKGDIALIKPGSSIPVDGKIIEGNSSIDQSSITGESIPVHKKIGDTVVSGTINKTGFLKIEATKVGEDTTLSQIIKLVEEASNSKAPISRLADKVSGIFVPIVIGIAIISAVVWYLLGASFEFALSIGIAVLVISCPCALGLATPVAIMVGTGKAAENGILIKSAEALEVLHTVDTIVFDKTGTITIGKPVVTDILNKIDKSEFLKIAGSLEAKSEHPLAEAIMQKVKGIKLYEISDFEAVSGRGIKAKIENEIYYAGNFAFMEENKINAKKEDKLLSQGKTVLYFAKENEYLGSIAVADKIKSSSKKAIEELKNKNINVAMITGDNKLVAKEIAKQVSIENIISEVLPQDKEKEVAKLQKEGKKVAFVGDGINDSPALMRADVGIAIGSGTDIAIESADIILMRESLLDVVTAIDLSNKVIKNIKMNLFWAFFYNSICIPVAAGVLYNVIGLKLNPMIGALAMSFSSVCVVTNALRLRKFKSNFKEENKMNVKIMTIEGMQCNHCKMSVEKALNTIEGVAKVEVDLEAKTARIEATIELDNDALTGIIEEAGFKVVKID